MFSVKRKHIFKSMSAVKAIYPVKENGTSTNNGTTVTFFPDPQNLRRSGIQL
jgi:hypothetical protein